MGRETLRGVVFEPAAGVPCTDDAVPAAEHVGGIERNGAFTVRAAARDIFSKQHAGPLLLRIWRGTSCPYRPWPLSGTRQSSRAAARGDLEAPETAGLDLIGRFFLVYTIFRQLSNPAGDFIPDPQ